MNSRQRRKNLRNILNFKHVKLQIENFPNLFNVDFNSEIEINIPIYNLENLVEFINKFYKTNVSLFGIFCFLLEIKNIKSKEIDTFIHLEFNKFLKTNRNQFIIKQIIEKEIKKVRLTMEFFKNENGFSMIRDDDFKKMYDFLYSFYEKDLTIKF
jgi:hypothetical protein